MKRILLLCCLFFSAILSTGYAKPVKIAFVNGVKIIQSYNGELDKKLSKEFKQQREALLKRQAEIKQQMHTLTRDESIMAASEKDKLERSLEKSQREFQRLSAAYQEDVTVRRNQELQKLSKKISSVITKLAQQQGFDVVLQSQAAIYASEAYNITALVAKQMESYHIA